MQSPGDQHSNFRDGPHMSAFLAKSYNAPAVEILIGATIAVTGLVFLLVAVANDQDVMLYIGGAIMGLGCLSMVIGVVWYMKLPDNDDRQPIVSGHDDKNGVNRASFKQTNKNGAESPRYQMVSTPETGFRKTDSQYSRTRTASAGSARKQELMKKDSVRSTSSSRGSQRSHGRGASSECRNTPSTSKSSPSTSGEHKKSSLKAKHSPVEASKKQLLRSNRHMAKSAEKQKDDEKVAILDVESGNGNGNSQSETHHEKLGAKFSTSDETVPLTKTDGGKDKVHKTDSLVHKVEAETPSSRAIRVSVSSSE